MENENDMAAKQLSPHQTKPSNVGRIAIIIAIILFVIGLVLYVASSDQLNPQTLGPENTKQQTTSTPPPKAKHVPGQIIVKFKEGVTAQQMNERLKPLNASVKTQIEGINSTVINVTPGQEEAVLKKLSNDPLVKYAEPDYIYYLQFVPNDPDFAKQWHLNNTGQADPAGIVGKAGADIHAEQAWDISKGTGVKVAILDSGIDGSQAEFANKIISAKSFTTATTDDRIGHGTHVAGILAAAANNGQKIAGVCPECQILIGKITTDDSAGTVPSSAIAPGITWAADSGAQVINMSIAGSTFSQSVQDAVNYAWGKNLVIVSAAGNNGASAFTYPAHYTNVVSVANTTNSDTLASTSNFGTWVSVAAPGNHIWSTLPTAPALDGGQIIGAKSGTSMASPVVAGVAALVWKTPYGTNNAAVVQRIFDTADKIAGTGTQFVHGRVNAANAVGTAPAPAPSGVIPSTGLTPSFVCGGSTNSICQPTQPAGVVSPGYAINPSNGVPYGGVVPSGIDTNNLYGNYNQEPGNSAFGHSHKKHKGGITDFVSLLLSLFLLLIQLLLGGFGRR